MTFYSESLLEAPTSSYFLTVAQNNI